MTPIYVLTAGDAKLNLPLNAESCGPDETAKNPGIFEITVEKKNQRCFNASKEKLE